MESRGEQFQDVVKTKQDSKMPEENGQQMDRAQITWSRELTAEDKLDASPPHICRETALNLQKVAETSQSSAFPPRRVSW